MSGNVRQPKTDMLTTEPRRQQVIFTRTVIANKESGLACVE